MVPDTASHLGGGRFGARRRVWSELQEQLSSAYTIYSFAAQGSAEQADFVLLGPRGLLFLCVDGGTVDVMIRPAAGATWTQRRENGEFVGAVNSWRPAMAAEATGERLLGIIPSCFRRDPAGFGRGLLHVLPDTTPEHTPAIDLASESRRILISSDTGRLAEWVERAMEDQPADPPITPALQRELDLALSGLVQPEQPIWRKLLRRRPMMSSLAAITALVMALASATVCSGPTLTPGDAASQADGLAAQQLPAFIPADAGWAVRAALEVAWDHPDRVIQWRHGHVNGMVAQLPHDGRVCRPFRISMDQGDAIQAEDRRYCR